MSRMVMHSIAGLILVIAALVLIFSTPDQSPAESRNMQAVASLPNPSLRITGACFPKQFQEGTVASSVPDAGTLVATTVALPATAPLLVTSTRVLFGNGIPFQASDLPASPLRTELESLAPAARASAMAQLSRMSFHVNDLSSLHVDPSGMPYYVCTFSNPTATDHSQGMPSSARAAAGMPACDTVSSVANIPPMPASPGILGDVPVTNPPIRHSRVGATNVLFLDFGGYVVTNTAWNNNTNYGNVARWDCIPFDADSNPNTFSDAEQRYIIEIWERVSEDYAPFDIDVTTEQPAKWTATTGHALITPTKDANGRQCPHYGAGGLAYIGCFGATNYAYYSPVFVTPMSGDSYAYTAESASHELGHNLGLSHDGTSTVEYYKGHGSNDVSWAPIMGTAQGRNVSQWSKGEYYDANQLQDDLAIIAAKTHYRSDDHGNTDATASRLTASNGTMTASGIISSNTDVDVFSFEVVAGAIRMDVVPYGCAHGSRGGNLDIHAQLYNSSGSLVAEDNNPPDTTRATINYTAPEAGRYYLHVSNSGTGNPTNNPPSGYTAYGSIGQYFVTGTVALVTGLLVRVPNGGEVWRQGQTYSNIWESGTNVGGAVKIELYQGGKLASTIADSVTNSGTYSWVIPDTQPGSTNCRIRISSVAQPAVWDESDACFTLPLLLDFTCTTNAGMVTIIKYTGSGGEVAIPGVINGLSVAGIGDAAFSGCTNITGVTIGTNVTRIGGYAFYGCTGLTNITIPNNVTSIGDSAFSGCTNITAVTIGTNVTAIGGYAFYGCTGLTNITIPNNVTNIMDGVFISCTRLVNIAIPDGVTRIGAYAFYGCTGLTNITIPNNVTNIGDWAFRDCTGLRSVTIGASVASIGNCAFWACTSMTGVTIGPNVTGIGSNAFAWCQSLTVITVNASNSFYSSMDGVLFNKGRTTLIQCPEGKAGRFTIPGSVTRIGDDAFAGCAGLMEIYFQGNAPGADDDVFDDADYSVVYYLPETTGWGPAFGGRSAVLWNPQVSGAGFGVRTNQFGFTITGASNLVIVVEACTDLANSDWLPQGTSILSNGSFCFSDPRWINYPGRFYHLRMP